MPLALEPSVTFHTVWVRTATSAYSENMDPVAYARRVSLRSIPTQALLLVALIASAPRTNSAEPPRHLEGRVPGTTLIVTATEGSQEPRSIGSYALRLYAPLDPAWPYDNFVDGALRPRDGGLAEVRFGDLDGDAALDIIVVIRSAGSGGYVSADGFLIRAKRLTFAGHVEGLRSAADPVIQLQRIVRGRTGPP